jgi:hypothetical protein
LEALDLAAARSALEEYANPRNWHKGLYIDDDEPWARAADALAKGEDHER